MAIEQILGIGFLMGILGSAHCIGMCGPLVMSLPISQNNQNLKWVSFLLYLVGKTLSYSVLGILVGIFGKQLFFLVAQQQISIIMGMMMLLYVLWVFYLQKKLHFNKRIVLFQQPILKALGGLFKSKSIFATLLIGFLNGLLPCGMVYLALGSAIATGSITGGGLFMMFFGLGTMPALMLVGLGGQIFGFKYVLQKWMPYMIATMGMVLILRGMNLGIPFLSPHIDLSNNIICHS
jgi:sulfite exporter TauE/SafE